MESMEKDLPTQTLRVSMVKALVLVLLVAAIYLSIHATRDLGDFKVYLTAGARALEAQPLYRPEDGFFQKKYLPAFALAVAPLAWLDPEVARVVWYATSFGLLVVFVRLSIRALPDRRTSERRLLALTLVIMAKDYLRELSLGQANLFLGVLIVAALTAAERRRPLAAGASIALAAFVKPYAALFVPWLTWTTGVAALTAYGALVAVGLALPALVYGWSGNVDLLAAWYRTVIETTAPNLLLPENVSLASMWAKWIGPGALASWLAVTTAAIAVGVVVVGGLTSIRRRRAGLQSSASGPSAYSELAALLVLVPLISPQGWDYVLLLATPAVVYLSDRWSALGRPWRMAVGASFVFLALPTRELLGLALHRRLMATAVVSVAALVISGAVVTLGRKGV